ncbi:uncharacterized protein ACIQIH_010449 [Cyanocitta cristata]
MTGRAEPSRAPRTLAGLRGSGGAGRAGAFRPQPPPSSRSHAWTGPLSPLTLGSRVGRTHGMFPTDLPVEENSPEYLTPLFRFCTAGPGLKPPGSRFSGRGPGPGLGPGGGLATRIPLTDPGTAMGQGRFSFCLFDSNSGPRPLSLSNQRHLRAAQPGPAVVPRSCFCPGGVGLAVPVQRR